MDQAKGIRLHRRLPLLIAGAAALFLLLFSLFREMGVVGTWKLYRTREQVMEENVRLRDENLRLRKEVENLKTNPSYIEEIARKELGLIGEKENVIVLDRKKDASAVPPQRKGPGRP
ncbi:MAG: FtsB family cell division protein [Deltaproteobacteria bacterium]|nr:septum formation initiator family protein [Candidatus Deferrimicrobiaceae bacterium]